jgi:hypothetical protein
MHTLLATLVLTHSIEASISQFNCTTLELPVANATYDHVGCLLDCLLFVFSCPTFVMDSHLRSSERSGDIDASAAQSTSPRVHSAHSLRCSCSARAWPSS